MDPANFCRKTRAVFGAPDVEAFLALAPEELAVKMLFLLRQYIAL
jgi:hypothetical protein